MYVHSIPNNNDNQDIVSMGTNAANITKTVIENTFEVLAIELMTIVQGLEYLNFEEKLSTRTQSLVRDIKKIVPPFTKDYIAYPFVQEVKDFLKNNDAY